MSPRFFSYTLALLIGGALLAYLVFAGKSDQAERYEGITKELVCTNKDCGHVMPYDAAQVTEWHRNNFVKAEPSQQRSIFFECPECKKYTLSLVMHVPEHLESGSPIETQ